MTKTFAARFAVIAAPLVVAACATAPAGPGPYGPPPPQSSGIYIQAPYQPADYAWSQAPGRNGIRGLSPKGYSCAGLRVAITPDGPYSRERIAKLYGSVSRADRTVAEVRAQPIANDNTDLARFVRTAQCDGQGRFAFDGLPSGSYFMIAQVNGPGGPLALMRHVTLRGDDIEPVQLTMTQPAR